MKLDNQIVYSESFWAAVHSVSLRLLSSQRSYASYGNRSLYLLSIRPACLALINPVLSLYTVINLTLSAAMLGDRATFIGD